MDAKENSSIIIIEKTEGKKIDYSISGTKLTLGDDELTLNLKTRERDYETQFDVCLDRDGCLSLGVSDNTIKYVAQVVIPARAYIEEVSDENLSEGEGQASTQLIPVEFDIRKCTLILWGMEE